MKQFIIRREVFKVEWEVERKVKDFKAKVGDFEKKIKGPKRVKNSKFYKNKITWPMKTIKINISYFIQ